MSPSAIGDPPHTRASSLNEFAPIGTTNGFKASRADGLRGSIRIFPHLVDLLSVKPDVDIHVPIRRLLQEAESCAKQAETQLDFKRPDVALQEFRKASIMMEEMIPRHKDYPALQADRGDLHRLYLSLAKRVSNQRKQFTAVEEAIKENNAKNGIQPSGLKSVASTGWRIEPREQPQERTNSHSRSFSSQNVPTSSTLLPQPLRKKPPIQPKPDALHGKTLPPSNGSNSASSSVDLAARFARLRSPNGNTLTLVQDPRIKTHPITIPQPPPDASNTSPITPESRTTMNRLTGPREMPSVPKPLSRPTVTSIGLDIPEMPQQPAPIYSPDRGTDSALTASLPTSIARNSSYSGRTNSAPPISTVRATPTIIEDKKDYFSSAHSQLSSNHPSTLPQSSTVSAEDLMTYLGQGSQALRVLVVDVRSREEFENGHIMAPSIICVEPITLRRGMSGDELGDTMVLAPDDEQGLYERRDEFDLVVFYDQSSTSLKPTGIAGFESHSKLHDFYCAIYEYGYEKRVKRKPLLLHGGLDAWVDLLGSSSLQIAPGITIPNNSRPLHPLSHSNAVRKFPPKRRRVVSSRPLSKEDEKKWEAALREETASTNSALAEEVASEDLFYARTTEDFLRKYPELPTMQESMVSHFPAKSSYNKFPKELDRVVPKPPARPAPALPRQRSSGISDRGSSAVYAHSIPSNSTTSISSSRTTPPLTGLYNPNVFCYMNASIQALSATPFLRELLLQYPHPDAPAEIPAGEKEQGKCPQLLTQFLSSVMHHLWSGQYDYIQASTLYKYINSIHAKTMTQADQRQRAMAFGGTDQQDSAEFLRFLLAILLDENNEKRNKKPNSEDDQKMAAPEILSPLTAAKSDLVKHQKADKSPISGKLGYGTISTVQCRDCHHAIQTVESYDPILPLPLNNLGRKDQLELKSYLEAEFGNPEILEDYKCDKCGKKDKTTQVKYITHLADYLIIHLKRFDLSSGRVCKIEKRVTFPQTIDLTPYFAKPEPRDPDPAELPRAMKGPFKFDVYAVVQQSGTLNSGHYVTVARCPDKAPWPNGDGPGDWHKFNDIHIETANWSNTQAATTYMIFLRRQGANDNPFSGL